MTKEEMQAKITDLETEMVTTDFWSDKVHAQRVIKEIAELKGKIVKNNLFRCYFFDRLHIMNIKKNIFLITIAVLAIIPLAFFFLREGGEQYVPGNLKTNSTQETSTTPAYGKYEQLSFPGNTLDTSDWQTYHNEEFGFEVRYPKGWGIKEKTKKQLIEENPGYAEYGSSYQGKIILDPHSDPYSFVTFDVYFESVDQVVKKREGFSFKDPGPWPRRTGQINNMKVFYYLTPDTLELALSLVFLGSTDTSYEVHDTLSGFPGIFEQILLSFKLIK